MRRRGSLSASLIPPRTEQRSHFRGIVRSVRLLFSRANFTYRGFFKRRRKRKKKTLFFANIARARTQRAAWHLSANAQAPTCIKRRPTARWNCGLGFLSQDHVNTFMDFFFILIVGRMGSEGGAGTFRLVNSTQPQTGFDSVCVALKVTRKIEGQIKAGGGGATGTRERHGPTEGYYKRREKPSKHKKQYLRKKKISRIRTLIGKKKKKARLIICSFPS